MGLNIRSEEVNRLAEKLAAIQKGTKTDAVRIALEEALARRQDKRPLAERLKPLLDEMDALPEQGSKPTKPSTIP